MKTVKTAGEFGLIRIIRQKFKAQKNVLKGIGDDAAVLFPPSGKLQLVTTDSLVEGVDFIKKTASPEAVGRKLASINLSDIAAMAGEPRHAVLSLGLPTELSLSWFNQFLNGLKHRLGQFRVGLVGGDISRAKEFWASLALLGEVDPQGWVTRSGARPGDQIFVTGSFGGSIYGKHLDFTPRVREARWLAGKIRISSMIDVSDGLLEDLGHILEESHVGARIYASRIPVSKACRKPRLVHALTDGEDFELLLTAKTQKMPRSVLGIKITRIGEIVERAKGMKIFASPGRLEEIHVSKKGFVHF